jgi:hypothetical protein
MENTKLPIRKVCYVNCTPHTVNIYALDGVTLLGSIEPSGIIPRASEETTLVAWDEVENLGGVLVPTVETVYGKLEDCPSPEEGVVLIVSFITAKAAKDTGRTTSDLRVPGKGVRDERGVIHGAIGTAQI